MSKSSKGEGTKIAQAAKDLGVTSVTIRRYVAEFNIETTSDENGIKVLPERAMEEMHEIRRLKEDGMTNPKVLEHLEEMRLKQDKPEKAKAERKPAAKRISEAAKAEPLKKEVKEIKKPERKVLRKTEKIAPEAADDDDDDSAAEDMGEAVASVHATGQSGEEGAMADIAGDGRSKHSLTCQTCGKTFEHMNPRLRDCLDCYRSKRKERRRDKHKNVIQHPLAAQVASKQQQRQSDSEAFDDDQTDTAPIIINRDRDRDRDREAPLMAPSMAASPLPMSAKRVNPLAGIHKTTVRNYRKAIEETRGITANLKRRLERPDLPENERRWLEQIYAYQLILHQGWRHLAEYKAGGAQGSSSHHTRSEAPKEET